MFTDVFWLALGLPQNILVVANQLCITIISFFSPCGKKPNTFLCFHNAQPWAHPAWGNGGTREWTLSHSTLQYHLLICLGEKCMFDSRCIPNQNSTDTGTYRVEEYNWRFSTCECLVKFYSILLQKHECVQYLKYKICILKNIFGSPKSQEIQAVTLQFLACGSTSQQWTTAFTCHVKLQSFQYSPHYVNPVPTPPHNLLIPYMRSQIPSKSTPLFGLILVFKSAQVEPKIQPGQLGFKEPHWMAAKIPHTAPIATVYSEIMIQTMQQVSKEYQVPLSRRFLLSSINTYAL